MISHAARVKVIQDADAFPPANEEAVSLRGLTRPQAADPDPGKLLRLRGLGGERPRRAAQCARHERQLSVAVIIGLDLVTGLILEYPYSGSIAVSSAPFGQVATFSELTQGP